MRYALRSGAANAQSADKLGVDHIPQGRETNCSVFRVSRGGLRYSMECASRACCARRGITPSWMREDQRTFTPITTVVGSSGIVHEKIHLIFDEGIPLAREKGENLRINAGVVARS